MKVFVIALSLFLLAAAPVAARADVAVAYSSIQSDLPLMPGMAERADSLVMFDKPEGRIAEITVDSTAPAPAVLDYYKKVLPPLGWQAENPQVWRRDGEELTLRFNKDRSVVMQLSPAGTSAREN